MNHNSLGIIICICGALITMNLGLDYLGVFAFGFPLLVFVSTTEIIIPINTPVRDFK